MTASIYKFCLSGTIYMVKRKEAVNMKLQSITEKQIQKFRKYLVNEEKSDATIECALPAKMDTKKLQKTK